MSCHHTHQPRWSTLSKIVMLALGLFVLEPMIHLTPAHHKLLLLAIILLVYCLFGLWIQSNARELEDLTDGDQPREIWRSPALKWNNRKENSFGELDRLEDEPSFDTLRL